MQSNNMRLMRSVGTCGISKIHKQVKRLGRLSDSIILLAQGKLGTYHFRKPTKWLHELHVQLLLEISTISWLGETDVFAGYGT